MWFSMSHDLPHWWTGPGQLVSVFFSNSSVFSNSVNCLDAKIHYPMGKGKKMALSKFINRKVHIELNTDDTILDPWV
jgi:hypothetical protein